MITGPYIIVTGIPGSGKSSLGRQLAPMLDLEVIDRDDLLEAFFPGPGPLAAEERNRLSRRADGDLRKRAQYLGRGILVSFWRRPELSTTSGSPTEWLRELPGAIEVHCSCSAETAAQRVLSRHRHPGHGDADKDPGEVLAQLQALAELGPLGLEPLVEVSTEAPPSITPVLRSIEATARRQST